MKPCAIAMTARERAELVPVEAPSGMLGPNELRGPTVVTLISPGTELAAHYRGSRFPAHPGYAAVFRVEEVGAEVEGAARGDLMFCMGPHRSYQQVDASEALPVPHGLAPESAVVARLMGVSMTTLMTTTARPGDVVLVTGAGPVGYLAAHLFACSGYDVHAVEPEERRREIVRRSGIAAVHAAVPVEDPAIQGRVALVVECSGHEQAVLDACRTVRRRGEVVLVGVPWQRRTDLTAHELLSVVFHKYVVLRSGWEWELPRHGSDFAPHSTFSGFRLAVRWLAEGRIPTDGLIEKHRPQDAQAIYESLDRGTSEGLFQEFDWAGA